VTDWSLPPTRCALSASRGRRSAARVWSTSRFGPGRTAERRSRSAAGPCRCWRERCGSREPCCVFRIAYSVLSRGARESDRLYLKGAVAGRAAPRPPLPTDYAIRTTQYAKRSLPPDAALEPADVPVALAREGGAGGFRGEVDGVGQRVERPCEDDVRRLRGRLLDEVDPAVVAAEPAGRCGIVARPHALLQPLNVLGEGRGARRHLVPPLVQGGPAAVIEQLQRYPRAPG